MQTRSGFGLIVVVVLLTLAVESPGAFSITNPTENEGIDNNSSITTYGTTDMGVDVLVKIRTPSNNTAASKSIEIEETMTDWEWEFPSPQGGWDPVANDWKVILYNKDTPSVPEKVRFFNITTGA
jgi:hypothetical protein